MEVFGRAPDGSPVQLVTLQNGPLMARVMTWGASLVDLRMDGGAHALVLGSSEFDAYLGPLKYSGAIVGRVANRIGGARAVLGGRAYALDANEAGRTTLHGGATGTGEVNWALEGYDASSCRICVTLADGQDGFPGVMDIAATYHLEADGVLCLEIEATTDTPTWCNMAQHSYWNLDGAPTHAAHLLTIPSDTYLAVDDTGIPSGPPQPVTGSRFDFRGGRQVTGPADAGLDHSFCFAPASSQQRLCTLGAGGVRLDVDSTEVGLQVYDGRHFAMGAFKGHGGVAYGPYAGVALEPQGWPDAPNRPDFPSVRLDPEQTYLQRSVFRLSRA